MPYFFKPDCLRILFNVPGAKSSLGFPGTVTRPGLLGCLNWRWLPRVTAKYQPSSASMRNMSDTFIAEAGYARGKRCLTMRLSDAGMWRRQTKLIYSNHRLLAQRRRSPAIAPTDC